MLRALQCPNAVDAPAGAHDRRRQNADATTGETAIAPTGGGALGFGATLPHWSTRRHDSVRRLRQPRLGRA
jgi:hypothetical protein